MTDSTDLIRKLVALPGPPGDERYVREWLEEQVRLLGFVPETDPKGNLIVRVGTKVGGNGGANVDRNGAATRTLVTAHMDEIAIMVSRIETDGRIRVAMLGGLYPWKWGEGPVEIIVRDQFLPGILSFGCIHTNSAASVAEFARKNPLDWEHAYVFTGLSVEELAGLGVRPGLRVVISRSRRIVTEFGPYVSSYFIDDRADLAVWLMALETIAKEGSADLGEVIFAATVSEEVGGEGAQYLLRTQPADICVALEIGPKTPEADFPIDASPTVWVRDGYAAMESIDGDIVAECCRELGIDPHWQYLSRGGSDASCAASRGFTARPVTFGLAVENSHGYEIMHKDAPQELRRLLLSYLRHIA